MGTTASRNDCISGYFPGMAGTSGIKSYFNNLKAVAITGSITSANVQKLIAHPLGTLPKVVIVTPWYGANEAKNFTSGVVVGLSNVSAATATGFYVLGNKATAKFQALLIG